MEQIDVIITRESAHSLRAEVTGHREAGVHHGKKATIALAKLAEHNKSLFNLHKEGERDTGLKITRHQIGKIFYAQIQDRPLIKFESADSFEEAFGKLIQREKEEFNIREIKHIGK